MKKVTSFFGKLRRESSRAEKYKVDEFEEERRQKEAVAEREEQRNSVVYTFLGIDQVRSMDLQTKTIASYISNLTLETFSPEDIVPLDDELLKMPNSEKIYFSFTLSSQVPPEKKNSMDYLFQKTPITDFQPCDSDHWVMESLREARLNRSSRSLNQTDVVRITAMQKWKGRMKERYEEDIFIEDVSNVEFKVWKGSEGEKDLLRHCTFETFYVEDYDVFLDIMQELKNPDYQRLVNDLTSDLLGLVIETQEHR